MLIAANLVVFFVVIGHFIVGTRLYLLPMLEAEFDPVARKIMHCLFHYSSVFLVLSALVLTCVNLGLWSMSESRLMLLFIAAQFAGCGFWQIYLAATSGIPGWPAKLFQWTLFLLAAALILLGL